jgi:DNA-binding MarR family transcriptional regulator
MTRRAAILDDRRPDAAGPASSAAPRFDLDQHIFFWFTQVVGRRDRQLASELKGWGLRVFEWRVLASLHSRRLLSMSAVADFAAVDRTTLSRTTQRMVRRGWIQRRADRADLRVIRLALTAEGTRLFGRVWPAVARLNAAATEGLPHQVIDLMRWAMAAMRRNLDASLKASLEASLEARAHGRRRAPRPA